MPQTISDTPARAGRPPAVAASSGRTAPTEAGDGSPRTEPEELHSDRDKATERDTSRDHVPGNGAPRRHPKDHDSMALYHREINLLAAELGIDLSDGADKLERADKLSVEEVFAQHAPFAHKSPRDDPVDDRTIYKFALGPSDYVPLGYLPHATSRQLDALHEKCRARGVRIPEPSETPLRPGDRRHLRPSERDLAAECIHLEALLAAAPKKT